MSAIGSAERRRCAGSAPPGRATWPSPPSSVHERPGQRRDDGRDRHARRRARATAPARRARRGVRVAPRAVQPRHARRRPVGQEDAQRDDVRQHRRRERERRELRRAEVADDRGVDQQVQRLGGERAEGGQRQPQDLAVVGGAAHRGHSTIRPWSGPSRCSPPSSLAACGATRRSARRSLRARRPAPSSARWPARPRPVTLPSGTRLSQCVRQRAQRRRPADRGRRAHARGRPPRRRGAGGRRGRRAAARLPRRRRAARRAAHGGHPRRAAAPHRARGARCSTAPARGSPRAGPRAARRGGDGMKLRLYHHPDGARVAYRETGTGPGLVLLHSALLSHREFEPVVEHLADRYRLDPPRPAAARRLRGPPAPSLHAGLARRGHRRLLPARPPGRARWSAATTWARRSCCARSSCGRSRRGGSCSCPTRCTARRRARTWRTAARAGRACRASTAC